MFSLVPAFDYPSATRRSVEDTFKALTKSVSLPALKVDDVFLVGRKDPESGVMTVWGVFKVMAVFEEGTGVRLVLNYKYI